MLDGGGSSRGVAPARAVPLVAPIVPLEPPALVLLAELLDPPTAGAVGGKIVADGFVGADIGIILLGHIEYTKFDESSL